ncbi:CueP family metal-binding protein [Tessaracoccus antarcticus]|uniref:CueP family metal-binding protein n=1 Tax=Tessaracoccus antarcticus TaxID=2479848 RepID=UPI0018F68EFE|nr:CueP family metal-binding protein [Tessaracoccus antarcticus]
MNRARTALLTAVSLLSLGAVAGCSASTGPTPAPSATSHTVAGDAEAILASRGLSGKSPQEVVEALDQDPTARPLPLMASVRYDEVTLDDGTTQATLPLDGDEFYISVAPYESRTHDCYFHSLGTCQGELTNTDVHVTVVSEDGETLVDEDATTYANGFVGFWVPKDVSGTVTVTKDGKTGEVAFSSDKEGATCITTLQLV